MSSQCPVTSLYTLYHFLVQQSGHWWRPVIKKLISNTDREESKPEECSYRTCWVIETLFGDPPQLSPSMVAVVTRKSCLPEPILCRNFTKHFLQWVPLTNVCQGLLPCDAWLMMVTDMGSHNDGHNDQWPLRPDRAPRSFFYPVIECQRPCEGKEQEGTEWPWWDGNKLLLFSC